MRLSNIAGVLLLVAISCHSSWGDVSVNVPLGHWSYRFIERCEAKGLLTGVGDGIKPFSRLEVARALTRVDSISHRRGRGGRMALTRIEREELSLLMMEFRHEVSALRPKGRWSAPDRRAPRLAAQARSGQPLATYHHGRGEVHGDLLFRTQGDLFTGLRRAEREAVYRNALGGVVRGQVLGKVGFRAAFEQTREEGTRAYRLREDIFERRLELPQLKGNRADYHQGMAYFVFSLSFLDVEVGKDEVSWGPGPTDNLGLSSNAPAFDMLRLKARLGAVKLVSIAGALRPCPDRLDSPVCAGVGDTSASYVVNGITRALDRDKYLAAHRLEAAVAPWLDVGFQEVLVYGDRGLQLTYLNPIMFYWAAQSYQGDKDNLMMGVDLDLHPGNGLRLYLAYVVDDLKKLRVFSDDFTNKFSFQTGFLWADPIGLNDLDLRAEYIRIEPWIYTHKFPINTFRHFDSPLGHSMEPNSDRWQVGAARRLSRDLSFELHLSRNRHGSNEVVEGGRDENGEQIIRNVGGDLHRGWRPGDDRKVKKFLDGNVSRRTGLGAEMSYRLLPRFTIDVAFQHEWGDNVPLPPSWGPNTALQSRTGYGDGNQRHFRFALRYGNL